MTHQTLIETLYKLELTSAKVLIPQKTVYVTRPSADGYIDEFIVLLQSWRNLYYGRCRYSCNHFRRVQK